MLFRHISDNLDKKRGLSSFSRRSYRSCLLLTICTCSFNLYENKFAFWLSKKHQWRYVRSCTSHLSYSVLIFSSNQFLLDNQPNTLSLYLRKSSILRKSFISAKNISLVWGTSSLYFSKRTRVRQQYEYIR